MQCLPGARSNVSRVSESTRAEVHSGTILESAVEGKHSFQRKIIDPMGNIWQNRMVLISES